MNMCYYAVMLGCHPYRLTDCSGETKQNPTSSKISELLLFNPQACVTKLGVREYCTDIANYQMRCQLLWSFYTYQS